MLEWKFKKLKHDNADKGKIKLSGTDTPAFCPHSFTFSPKFNCEVRKTTALISRKIKKKMKKKKFNELHIQFQKK